MFRKFSQEESVTGQSQVKSSVQRGISRTIKEQYPTISDEVLEAVLPKKQQLTLAKCHDHINLVVVDKEPVFFQQRDGPFYPTLRVLHKAGDFMPILQVDKGAIKFVVKGANIMCPGITSAGGSIPESLPVDTPVQIMAYGKQLPLAIGITKMSTDDMKSINNGIAVEVLHSLGDGLWLCNELE